MTPLERREGPVRPPPKQFKKRLQLCCEGWGVEELEIVDYTHALRRQIIEQVSEQGYGC